MSSIQEELVRRYQRLLHEAAAGRDPHQNPRRGAARPGEARRITPSRRRDDDQSSPRGKLRRLAESRFD